MDEKDPTNNSQTGNSSKKVNARTICEERLQSCSIPEKPTKPRCDQLFNTSLEMKDSPIESMPCKKEDYFGYEETQETCPIQCEKSTKSSTYPRRNSTIPTRRRSPQHRTNPPIDRISNASYPSHSSDNSKSKKPDRLSNASYPSYCSDTTKPMNQSLPDRISISSSGNTKFESFADKCEIPQYQSSKLEPLPEQLEDLGCPIPQSCSSDLEDYDSSRQGSIGSDCQHRNMACDWGSKELKMCFENKLVSKIQETAQEICESSCECVHNERIRIAQEKATWYKRAAIALFLVFLLLIVIIYKIGVANGVYYEHIHGYGACFSGFWWISNCEVCY